MAKKTNPLIWIGLAVVALFVFGIIALPGTEMAFQRSQATLDKPLFEMKFLSPPTKAVAGQDLSYEVEVKNVGASGELFVDSGLYPQKQIEGWYGKGINLLFALQTSVEDVKTCQPETFVDSKRVTLANGAMTTVKFTIQAPSAGTYYLNVGSFERCWEKDGDEGYRTGRVSKSPVVVSAAVTPPIEPPIITPPEEKFDLAEWWNGLGVLRWIIVVFIGVLLIAMLFPQQKNE